MDDTSGQNIQIYVLLKCLIILVLITLKVLWVLDISKASLLTIPLLFPQFSIFINSDLGNSVPWIDNSAHENNYPDKHEREPEEANEKQH